MRCKRRPVVNRFADTMERVLRQNDHKGGWNDEPLERLLHHLGIEFTELMDVLISKKKDRAAIAKEAVDIAIFCMMIADVYGDLGAVDV